jgi:hypothetical protein
LIALGYLIVYLAKGKLPWQKVRAKTKQKKYDKILALKQHYSHEALCQGLPGMHLLYLKSIIDEFAKYLNMVSDLEFT